MLIWWPPKIHIVERIKWLQFKLNPNWVLFFQTALWQANEVLRFVVGRAWMDPLHFLNPKYCFEWEKDTCVCVWPQTNLTDYTQNAHYLNDFTIFILVDPKVFGRQIFTKLLIISRLCVHMWHCYQSTSTLCSTTFVQCHRDPSWLISLLL